eukprot:TRINITY_DN3720_c0_g1_i1.p1 TRINITY_DN3720_c0_g1~~TRINITY_DN3720_c0_g1_i1.p1  ORF type:complete len:299 (+),score=82.00 TRINITY_DN3720_c0_g1_i1:494-1390(+)
MVYERLIDPFMAQKVTTRPFGLKMQVDGDVRHYGKVFWKEVLKRVQHGVFHTAMLSDAALRDISVRLALSGFEEGDLQYVTAPQDGWVEPKKNMYWYLLQGVLYVPTPNMLSTRFKTAPPLPIGTTARVQNWDVTAERYQLAPGEEGDARYSDHRALPKPCRVPPFVDPAALLDGTFCYYLAAPPGTEQVVWQDAGEKVPWCWKQVHARYHAALPVACAPPVTTDAFDVVKVTYRYVEHGVRLATPPAVPSLVVASVPSVGSSPAGSSPRPSSTLGASTRSIPAISPRTPRVVAATAE